ncbi:hypothetical protein CCY99_01155 [Helicobacter sp. 16-1353]|uniref:HDOD domain-containing protein n=1 Tax=Helicobacter sp. 16-1353 TaxID=2004996 RepID=UPI000DCE53CF|nr:HDOD domain-containing protein [Helicobacter sp. 16-1353]RAX55335.1 hypothetical protein CCY99_01155 [Helicobacter sp. 16-1353]
MKDIYNQTIKSISSFPALSNVVSEVCKTCQDPNSSIADLVKIIEKDQGATIDILRTANSPIYGFTREIVSVKQAVSLFGMGTIKGFVISLMFRNSLKFDLSPYNININQYLDTCREHNKFVMEIFKNEENSVKEIIFPASFLMNAGSLILSNEINKALNQNEMIEFMNEIQNCYELMTIEKEFMGISAVEVTAMLFEHWNFEVDLINAIKNIAISGNNIKKRNLTNPLKAALKCINFYHKYTPQQIDNTKKFMKNNLMNVDFDYFDKFVENRIEVYSEVRI